MAKSSNNFNLLRLLFALFVVFTHSYQLSTQRTYDFLSHLTGGQVEFSYIGLTGFFTISGYLIFQSLTRSSKIIDFIWRRVLRIFPGLLIVLLLTVLLGPLIYEGGLAGYLLNETVWKYIPSNLTLFFAQFTIDGIFTHNAYPSTINGSLWTLPYEFAFYIFLSALIFVPRRIQIPVLIILSIALIAGNLFWMEKVSMFNFLLAGRWVAEFGAFFCIGSLLAVWQVEKFKSLLLVAFACILLLALFTSFGYFHEVKLFLLPVSVIGIGLASWPWMNQMLDRTGDISYGVYIYSFPIQQTLMYYLNLDASQMIAPSLLLSILFGYASWHLIERRALQFKSRFH